MMGTVMIFTFMIIFSELFQDNLSEKKRLISEDFCFSIQNEFFIAAQANQGYSRTFTIPEDLEGFDYEIAIYGRVLVLNYSQGSFSVPIPYVNGSIQKGINTLTNINNSLCLNC